MRVVVTLRHVIVGVAAAASLVATTSTPAAATDDPLAGIDASVRRAAEKILASAAPGDRLKVVITSRTSDAPSITSKVVSTEVDALRLIASALSKPATIGVDIAHPVRIAVTNDTFRSKQWALDRLRAETVWQKSSGSGVVVAVVDTGVRADHPDLKGHVLAGRDFIAPGTSAADQNGHGTHVAGIIAAYAGNARGIAGLARYSRILPVRVLDASGGGDSAGVANGIIWAVKNGADVINLSLGSSQSDSAGKAAVAYAVSKNVVVVAAAGNDGCNAGLVGGLFGPTKTYPAAYERVLGVGAITRYGNVASYSNCGSYVDVVAPGSGIISTMIASPNSGLGCSPNTYYCTLSGTSMATPYAAATAALARSRHPSWSQWTIRSKIQSTTDNIGPSGRDDASGYGAINPRRLLAQ